ncbi:FAD dependent oxidoreductase [Panus rudis PR-1116 ss-1]|nr:FAD dependent oxidoreductase [Panus rudis PR-1116 ss-1]
MATEHTKNIVIIGGGIIGCTTAYYLAHHPAYDPSTTKVTLLEASVRGIAQGASGKAGGLCAKWAYPKELVDISFPEHERLAELHDGAKRWGWRYVECGSWEGRGEIVYPGSAKKSRSKTSREGFEELGPDWETKKRVQKGLPAELDWIKTELTDSYSKMAETGETAQVHPYLFSRSMIDLAREKGVQVVRGRATSIDIDESTKSVTGVKYTDNTTKTTQTLPATHVILAAGVWSPQILPKLPIIGTRAHSITIQFDPPRTFPNHVLFTEITLPSSRETSMRIASPEIYPRPSNEVYCCGPGDSPPIPDTVDDVTIEEGACESVFENVSSISEVLREGKIGRRQACFLPVVSTGGGPIIGDASHVAKGLVIGTGHTCWGISNAPGTAKALAELVLEGTIKCANLKKLEPARFI